MYGLILQAYLYWFLLPLVNIRTNGGSQRIILCMLQEKHAKVKTKITLRFLEVLSMVWQRY